MGGCLQVTIKMVKLKKEILNFENMLAKLKCMFVSILLIINFGCFQNRNKLQKHKLISEYVSNNFNKYDDVYKEVNETIKFLIDSNQKRIIDQIGHDYRIDRLIIFNKEYSKFYTTINTNFKEYNGSNDLIQSLYGVKIEGKWYVFFGANLIAMRDGYKYNKYEPFTWEELSYVAHEQMFGRFLSYVKDGNLKINTEVVENEINPSYLIGTQISNEGTDDERFIRLWNYKNSQTLDSTEIAQIKEDLEAGKDKPKDPIKKVTWWDRLWGKEIPIFETDEWNEYIKSKSSQ